MCSCPYTEAWLSGLEYVYNWTCTLYFMFVCFLFSFVIHGPLVHFSIHYSMNLLHHPIISTSKLHINAFSSELDIKFTCLRSPVCPHPLLCQPLWRHKWSCESYRELDTEWWRQCWFLPHQHYQQCSPDSIWRTSKHHHCQYHTVWTDWFSCRLSVQHHNTWSQL